MTDVLIDEHSATGNAAPVNLPPTSAHSETASKRRLRRVADRASSTRLRRKHGDVFRLDLPVFGRTVIVADPLLAKQLFTANTDDVGNIQPNLSRVLGPGSVFALDGADHKRRRRLLTPPFHGKSVKNYETIFEEETLRESANWPEGQEFETLEPMMRITLNAILRAVFGADGEQLDELRRIIPPWVTLGSRLAVLPTPAAQLRPVQPVGPVGGVPTRIRRGHRPADRRRDGRPELRAPRRRAGAAAAKHLRGRLGDVAP